MSDEAEKGQVVEPRGALDGLKVLDFSWVIAGPVLTQCLGAQGATVIKVESITKTDIFRAYVPMAGGIPGVNRCGTFDMFNSDKLSLTLNLNKPGGVEIAKRLVLWADVVVENFTPGTLEKWGLSYRELKEVRPDLIMVSLSMQGQTGPHSRQAGFGTDLQSLVGFTNFVRWPDREPTAVSIPYPDFIVPWYGIVALLAAIDHRQRTGQGQHLDISQVEAGAVFLSSPIMDYLVNGRATPPMGNRSPYAAPHGAYRCRGDDRWCVLAVLNDAQWSAFCKAIGDPAWARETRFSTLMGRKENEDDLNQLVEQWTLTQTAEEVMATLQRAGVPAGIVATGQDIHADPQLGHRTHFRILDHPEIGPHFYETPSWRLSLTPCEIRRPSPCLGEHTEYVCTNILGMSDEEIARLLAEGVLE